MGGRRLPDFVAVARVLGPDGVKGLLKVQPLTDFPDRLLGLDRVRLNRSGPLGGKVEWRSVTGVERKGSRFSLSLEGTTNRDEAWALAGALIEVPRSEVRSLPPGSFYRFEILGLAVYDETGRALGMVTDILETGANDVYVVTRDAEGQGRAAETLVPALKETVLEVDVEGGRMLVRLPKAWEDER